MAAGPGRPAQPVGNADDAAIEPPGAVLALERDSLRRRRNVGIEREDAAFARAGDAVAPLAADLAARTHHRALAAGEEQLVAIGLALRLEGDPLRDHAGRHSRRPRRRVDM